MHAKTDTNRKVQQPYSCCPLTVKWCTDLLPHAGVARVYAAECAFAAVRTDGTLVTPATQRGSRIYVQNRLDLLHVEHPLSLAVDLLASSLHCSFWFRAVIRFRWGYPRYGGCCEAVRTQLVAEALKAACERQTPR